MTRITATPRVPLILLAVAFLASCTDNGPVNLSDDLAPALSVQNAGNTGYHILDVSRGQFRTVSRAIGSLGGSIVRSHDDAGIIIATGLSDDAVGTLQDMGGVKTLAADIMIQGIPDGADLSTIEMSAGDAPTGHNPSLAGLFTLQWDKTIIDADDAWAAGFSGSPSITVAILDTGIDPAHQDLAGLVDAGRSVAFVTNANPALAATPWADDHFHGTHVAGTVVTNGIGTSGVAPHTTLMAVKVCGAFFGCPFSAIISGIIHASDNGANVINMSLGGFIGKSFPGGGQLNALLNTVMNYAARNDVLVVSAAGNDGFDLDHLGRDFGAGSFVATPCESGNGMCISATGPTDALAGYSNFGRSAVDIAAPGGDFDVTGDPFTSVVLAPCNSASVALPFSCGTSSYLFLQGTSMATPQVSGAAALLAAQGTTKPGQLKMALQRSADDLGKKGTDATYSKGRLNVFQLVNN